MKFRTEREKVLVLGGGIVMGVLLYVALILFPLLDRIGRDEKFATQLQSELEDARRLGARLQILKVQPATKPASMVQEVDRVTRELGIEKNQIVDLRVFGNKGVQLKVEDLDGSTLVRLLYALQKVGVFPDGLEMHDAKGQGIWTVTLRVTGS